MTISPKFQVVIPADVRKRLQLKPGQKLSVIASDGCVLLIPVRPPRELMGIARGIDTRVEREPDRS